MEILIVDDSFTTRKLIAGHLRNIPGLQCEIVESSGGNEAMRLFEERRPDLVLLDYLLQDMNGIDVVRALKKKHDILPVVMVTGFDDVQLAAEAMHLGVQGYMLKDRLSAETLLWTIRNAEERIKMQRMIRAHRKEIEEFSRTVAHNLRDKISSINSLIEMAKEYKKSDPIKFEEFIDVAQEAAKQSHLYLDRLFSFVAITQHKPDMIMFPPEKLLTELKEEMAIGAEGIHKDVTLRYEDLPLIYGSYAMLYNVFRHLVTNAVSYAGKDATIRIEAEEDENGWLIRVKDNGKGITDEEKERIFNIFERGAASRGVSGTGIGLAMCRRIVEEMHGGRMWAAPTAHGACFCFTLPKTKQKDYL